MFDVVAFPLVSWVVISRGIRPIGDESGRGSLISGPKRTDSSMPDWRPIVRDGSHVLADMRPAVVERRAVPSHPSLRLTVPGTLIAPSCSCNETTPPIMMMAGGRTSWTSASVGRVCSVPATVR